MVEKQTDSVIAFLFKCIENLQGAWQTPEEAFAYVFPSNSCNGPVRMGMPMSRRP